MTARILSITVLVSATMIGCAPSGDTITEVENGVNGTKVETRDDREFYFRRGIDLICEPGDRVWECAKQSDLLVERR